MLYVHTLCTLWQDSSYYWISHSVQVPLGVHQPSTLLPFNIKSLWNVKLSPLRLYVTLWSVVWKRISVCCNCSSTKSFVWCSCVFTDICWHDMQHYILRNCPTEQWIGKQPNLMFVILILYYIFLLFQFGFLFKL